ncbi:unnamed protein product [Chironomus riparius]|uniref:BTB domain-containing protein n=1 Tax=Chironomus riparius TaxID=315576 RepID=A0A9N9WS61_9DIPT|nr:unnamed protein product [Chironomus riparius]
MTNQCKNNLNQSSNRQLRIQVQMEQINLSKVLIHIVLPFPLESTELNIAKSSPYTVRFGNQVIRMQLSIINRCYAYICYLSLHSEENENVTVMKKFQLNFGFLHSNDDVIFPPSNIGDGIDTDDGRLHEISTPGAICIESMIRIPIESRQAFKITKTIICQIKFHKESDESEKILDAATVKAYETFLNDEILTDCIILCEEGKRIKAHKVMLAAHSSIFYSMLRNSNEINMKNVQHNIVSEMMRFLYCRKINGSEYILLELLKVADEYEINDLKKFSEHQLMRGVTIETAVERSILAHVHKALILKNFILEYICNRWNMIKENEVNVAMLDEYPLILREIINKFALRDNKKNNKNFIYC